MLPVFVFVSEDIAYVAGVCVFPVAISYTHTLDDADQTSPLSIVTALVDRIGR